MSNTAPPTVGRVVHFFDSSEASAAGKAQPWPATVTHVWGPECVNLSVHEDGSFPLVRPRPTSVQFYERAEDVPEGAVRYCLWPPRV